MLSRSSLPTLSHDGRVEIIDPIDLPRRTLNRQESREWAKVVVHEVAKRPMGSAPSRHARPSPAEKLLDLAEHVGDPWMARQLADIAADLDRPRRPGRPEGRSTVVRRRDAILRRLRALPVYRALSGETAARSMHRDFARWLRFRDAAARPHASPAAEWCELADDLGFIELPAIKTLKNIFAGD